jgi:hypothetical protein
MSCAAFSASAATLSSAPADIHENFQFSETDAVIAVTNVSGRELHVARVTPTRNGDRVSNSPKTLAVGATASIAVHIATDDDAGVVLHKFLVKIDGLAAPEIVSVRNFGISDLQIPHPHVDLGTISSPSPVWQSVTLLDAASKSVEWKSILDAPDFIDARFTTDQRQLELAGKPGGDYGLRQGIVHVALGSTMQRTAAIQVRAIVQGEIAPSTDIVSFGLTQRGQGAIEHVVLHAADSKPIVALRIETSRVSAITALANCPNNEAGCAILAVRLHPDQPAGRIVGELRLVFKNRSQALRLPVTGLLTHASDRITRLDVPNNVLDATPQPRLDIAHLLNSASQAGQSVSTAAKSSSGPLLAWQVANDSRLHGYLIARADSSEGMYRPIEPSIPRWADGAYQWRDATALTDNHYWYRIFAVHLDGHLQALGSPREIATRQTRP